MERESTKAQVGGVWPGISCLANCVIPLVNVGISIWHQDDLPYMPHRSKDPGAGAVTTYRAAPNPVERTIPAGGEIFISYGDDWFLERPHYFDDSFPLEGSFTKAQEILELYKKINFPPLLHTILQIKESWKTTSRTLNALPLDDHQMKIALENDVGHIYQQNATRSLEWLRAHGTCIDHIVHKPSGIAGAGEGAFAKRHLRKGTVVTGTSLLTFPYQSLMDIPGEKDDDESVDDIHHGPNSSRKQILYNYCFGHESTDLLFFPYAAVGALFINHGGRTRANVAVRWAKPGELRHNPQWLERDPDSFSYKMRIPRLGIEYFALTDIEEGEELFLDYGDRWDDAWEKHVKTWHPPELNTTAFDWNQGLDPIRTKSEQALHPYPLSVEVRCHVDLLLPEEYWTEEWKSYGSYELDSYGVHGLPCDVLQRSHDNTTYMVAIRTDKWTFVPVPVAKFDSTGNFILPNVPRKAIFFLDAPGESDLNLKGAFRHTMHLPDEMIPEIWRKEGYTTESGVRDEL